MSGIEVDEKTDEVIGMVCVNKEDKTRTVLVVSEKGYGKRTFLDDPETGEANYRITNRGGKGVRTIKITEKTGGLAGLLDVAEIQDLMITCESGITIRMAVNKVSEQSRATQGVKLIRIDENDKIAAITQIDEQEETEEIVEGAVSNELESGVGNADIEKAAEDLVDDDSADDEDLDEEEVDDKEVE